MNKELIKKFEVGVHYLLTFVIILYIGVEIIELIYQFGKALIATNADSSRLLITKEQTAQVIPVFFNILIGLGLINTFSIYIKEQIIKVQNILLLGLISMCRKLFVLDIGHPMFAQLKDRCLNLKRRSREKRKIIICHWS